MIGGRKFRSNKGKKRGSYRSRKNPNNLVIRVNNSGNRTITHLGRHSSGRKVRSNKGKKRQPYGPRTSRTRSGKKIRGGQISNMSSGIERHGACCKAEIKGEETLKFLPNADCSHALGIFKKVDDCECHGLTNIRTPESCNSNTKGSNETSN